jgi:16S rRNA (uracil1498-N3)-methyltransferase
MTIPRFFIPSQAIDRASERVSFRDGAIARQLTKVLRRRSGDFIDFLDDTGKVYHCQLLTCGKDTITAAIASTSEAERPSPIGITIALPPLKSGRFEWALEKLTELGARKIIPILVERSVVRPSAGAAAPKIRNEEGTSKMQRWSNILKEASEQCERTLLPQLVAPMSFQQFLDYHGRHHPRGLKFICVERSQGEFLGKILCNREELGDANLDDITIAIGAEGGFTGEEQAKAKLSGFVPVSLGHRILRAETAAIYALAIVAAHCVDMGPEHGKPQRCS